MQIESDVRLFFLCVCRDVLTVTNNDTFEIAQVELAVKTFSRKFSFPQHTTRI